MWETTGHRPHKGQWSGALMFSLICAWTNGWVDNWNAGGFRRRCAHYDVTVMNNGFSSPAKCKPSLCQQLSYHVTVPGHEQTRLEQQIPTSFHQRYIVCQSLQSRHMVVSQTPIFKMVNTISQMFSALSFLLDRKCTTDRFSTKKPSCRKLIRIVEKKTVSRISYLYNWIPYTRK